MKVCTIGNHVAIEFPSEIFLSFICLRAEVDHISVKAIMNYKYYSYYKTATIYINNFMSRYVSSANLKPKR